jgi:hypothetical protein
MRANHWIKIESIGILLSVTALADHGGNKNNNGNNDGGNRSFESSVVGLVPNTTVGGVPAEGLHGLSLREKRPYRGVGTSRWKFKGCC